MPRDRDFQGDQRRPRRAAQPKPKTTVPEIVTTEPKPFNRHRLFLRLLIIAAIVLSVCIGSSIFFKVDTVIITGAEKYSAWTVSQASGIQKGDSLFFFGRASAGSKIIAALPYVKSVRFGIKLPGTVNIIIEEAPVGYSVKASDGTWWLMTADGRVTEQTDGATADSCTKVLGITLSSPVAGQQAVASEQPDSGSMTTAADRLGAALQVLRQLEANEVLGKAASVDVSDLSNLQIWYGNQYQIGLGDSTRLDYKITVALQAISQMGPYESGILDASFTTFPDKVGYTKFPE